MRSLAIALLLLAPGLVAAQHIQPDKADYWIRAAVSNRAVTRGGMSAAALVGANMAFGGMVNQLRYVALASAESDYGSAESDYGTLTEKAVLVGVRSKESNRFLSAAAGIGIVNHLQRTSPGIALELHGTGFVKSWLGIGGGMVANINKDASFWAVIFSMDVGDLKR